jgi:hypothetical protein
LKSFDEMQLKNLQVWSFVIDGRVGLTWGAGQKGST